MNNEALAENIRGWVHYDNMLASLQKQVVNTRKERDKYDANVQQMLKHHQMMNAIIQISGGQLQVQEEKATSGLTLKNLQESATTFFRAHSELQNPDKLATEFLAYIKSQRTVTTTMRLKNLKPPA